ncbi:MAG: ATP-binding protein [Hyphomicrobiaceae bacterium]
MKLNSLAFRLFATTALWAAVVLPIAGFILFSIYKSETRSDFDARLKTLLYVILADSLAPGGREPSVPRNVGEPLFDITDSGWYWQITAFDEATSPRLELAMTSASLATRRFAQLPAGAVVRDSEDIFWSDVFSPTGKLVRMAELQYRSSDDPAARTYSYLVAGPLSWPQAREASFLIQLVIALACVAAALLLMTFLQIRFGLLPLRQIEAGLSAIRSGRAELLNGELPAEIGPLQSELNALIKSNQDIIERARTQVGNLAHALKTPLAVILNEAASEPASESTAKVRQQAETMRQQITHYLDRARMAANIGTVTRATEVEPVALSLVRALERIYHEKDLEIDLDIERGVVFQGERQDFEELMGNLLDNACKWCRTRVVVEVRSQTSASERGQLRMTVDDDGPGLAADDMQRIVKRGYRLDESKPGSGLGLSIVAELAALYHGSFDLNRSSLGGLQAVLILPAGIRRSATAADQKSLHPPQHPPSRDL